METNDSLEDGGDGVGNWLYEPHIERQLFKF